MGILVSRVCYEGIRETGVIEGVFEHSYKVKFDCDLDVTWFPVQCNVSGSQVASREAQGLERHMKQGVRG